MKCGQWYQGPVADHDCISVLRSLLEERVDKRTFNLALNTLQRRVEATDKYVKEQINKGV